MNPNSIRNHPYKSFDEQIIEIANKNIIIDDVDFAMEAIQSLSYYSIINGYKDLFIDKRRTTASKEVCLNGTTFSMLYTVHWMDVTLSGILFKYTLVIEKKLKTQISNLVAELYSIEENQYLDKRNYSQAKYNRGKIVELTKQIDDSKKTDLSAKHYFENECNVPPWIAAKSISFGSTIIWYSILKEMDKLTIINKFFPIAAKFKKETKLDFFDSMIDQVYQYRNLTAHGNRTFSLDLPKKIRANFLEQLDLLDYFKETDYIHQNDLLSLILSIFILNNDQFVSYNMVLELSDFFTRYSQKQFVFSGKDVYQLFKLPADIIERLIKFHTEKFGEWPS
ncbi:MAG: Abi family protein [Enterococcus italicus]|uniref:Abi family protein n=1 Tax=Enterococcus italicus TaxID=246144 RepID=UPI0039967FEB